MIREGSRIIFENLAHFFPEYDTSFVVYHKEMDAYYQEAKKWSYEFGNTCVFNYEQEILSIDLLVIAELFNHMFVTNRLDILSIFEYTMSLDKISFDYPLFDGKRDFLRIVELVKANDE